MKKSIIGILAFMMIYSIHSNAQEELLTKEFRILQEKEDTIIHTIKRDKHGNIKKLVQEYMEVDSLGVIYDIYEEYKKGKYWNVWTSKSISLKKNGNTTVYESVLDGQQFSFLEDGKIEMIMNYTEGELDVIYTYYHYYPNGNLQYIVEMKNDEIWNIPTYKFPDGQEHDYGNFKDGVGEILHLNEEGEPCLECIYTTKVVKGKNLM